MVLSCLLVIEILSMIEVDYAMSTGEHSPKELNRKVAEIIKGELKRGRIPIEREVIEEQQNEYVRRKLENFNNFILGIRELGRDRRNPRKEMNT